MNMRKIENSNFMQVPFQNIFFKYMESSLTTIVQQVVKSDVYYNSN